MLCKTTECSLEKDSEEILGEGVAKAELSSMIERVAEKLGLLVPHKIDVYEIID